MRPVPVLLALLLSMRPLFAESWYVDPFGTGDAPTIQAGIDSAAPGDTVLLARGTFLGAGNRDLTFRGKAIVLVGEGMPEEQVIDCYDEAPGFHRGFLFNSGEGPASILSRVTIRNGTAGGSGGGIYCTNFSSPTLIGVVLRANHANDHGGGMACYHASADLQHCTFEENTSEATGGGLDLRYSQAVLTAVRFIGNSAGLEDYRMGGGLSTDSAVVDLDRVSFIGNIASMGGAAYLFSARSRFTDCTFEGNEGVWCAGVVSQPGTSLAPSQYTRMENCVFSGNESLLLAGAMVFVEAIHDSILDCSFLNNKANFGGALLLAADLYFEGCRFEGNTARVKGGVAYGEGTVASFRNCLFAGNAAADSGGVLHGAVWTDVDFENCTITGSSAPYGAVASLSPNEHSHIELGSSIVANSDSGAAFLCTDPPECATATCSDFYANEGGDGIAWQTRVEDGEGNFAADPLFCNAAQGDYRLDEASPCLGAPGCGLVGAFGAGCDVATGVARAGANGPGATFLAGCRPNPFNATTTVRFGLAEGGEVLLTVHDAAGRRVAVLNEGRAEAGLLEHVWDGRDQAGREVPSGVYFVRLRAGGFRASAKAILLR